MNQIEQILANSIYESSQFNYDQIKALNEMLDLGINIEQIGIVASPSVSVLSYSILADYLKDHTITINEYNKYLSIDKDRINDIIVNVYLGKMHGLTEEQLELYANKNCKNIKQSRLIVEKYKDMPSDKLNKIITSKCGSDSIEGKMLIQEFLLGNVSIDRFLITCIFKEINARLAKDIMTGDERLIQLYLSYDSIGNSAEYYSRDANEVYRYIHLVYKLTSDNTAYVDGYLHDSEYYTEYVNGNLHFDSSYTLFYFMKKHGNRKLYDFNLTITKHMIDHDIENAYVYHVNEEGEIESEYDCRYSLLIAYLIGNICMYKSNTTYYNRRWQEMFSWDEFYAMYEKDRCNSFIKAISKGKDIDVVLKYYNYADNFVDLIKLYKTKKDKETEIPYLTEQLKDATNHQIKEVICMKENKCSTDEIHYFIEKYLSKITNSSIKPTTYYNDEYSKYFTITQYLDYSKFNIRNDILLKLKQANCTDEEIEFVLNNHEKIGISLGPVYRELIQACMYIGVNNINDKCYITDNSEHKDKVSKYTYAKSIFKNKPKCFVYYVFHTDYCISIPEHLLPYVDNFDDDTLYKVLNYAGPSTGKLYINYALQMSTVTTNVDEIKKLYLSMDNSKVEELTNIDEKITADVIVKFFKKNDVDVPDFIKNLIPESIDTTIEKSVEYFDSSKNFKPIKYDDETIYVDIVGNKALKGSHIITFNKEENDDYYEYIFEIAHEDNNLTYSAKIATKKDVKECITKSIALIENIDEYSEYVEELQNLLKTI